MELKLSKTKIVFMGSGPVAASTLQSLIENFDIEAIVTKSATKDIMSDLAPKSLVFAADDKQTLENIVDSNNFSSQIAVLVDYGVIVSKKVIDSFEMGIINSHFSLLPKLRGADPIAFAILEGLDRTGVSLMVIDEGLDTGKIIVQRSLKVEPREIINSLTDKLVELSNKLLGEYLPLYILGVVKARSQPHPDRATYSRKLRKEDGVINWSKPAEQIDREIRAFLQWPKSRTKLAEKDVIITNAQVLGGSGKPGTVTTENKSLVIYCGKGSIKVNKLKPAGKNEMPAEAFLAGYKI